MGITGEPDGAPMRVGVAVADICAGMFAAYAVLAALRARDRTGRGQWVDASMLDGQVAWMTYMAANYFATGSDPERVGSAHMNLVPYQPFRTRDGFVNVAVGSEGLWQRFCDALELPLVADPRFATNADRVAHRRELLDLLEPIFATRTTAEWVSRLLERGVPAGPISRMHEVMEDPQVLARGMVVEVDHPRAGRIRVNGVPVKLSETPGDVRTPPPVARRAHGRGAARARSRAGRGGGAAPGRGDLACSAAGPRPRRSSAPRAACRIRWRRSDRAVPLRRMRPVSGDAVAGADRDAGGSADVSRARPAARSRSIRCASSTAGRTGSGSRTPAARPGCARR